MQRVTNGYSLNLRTYLIETLQYNKNNKNKDNKQVTF